MPRKLDAARPIPGSVAHRSATPLHLLVQTQLGLIGFRMSGAKCYEVSAPAPFVPHAPGPRHCYVA